MYANYEIKTSSFFNTPIQYELYKAVVNNNLNKIINITNKNKIDLSYGKEILLRYSCAQHSNEIIKWLLKKNPKIKINILEGRPFGLCCVTNNLEICKLFYKKDPKIIKNLNPSLLIELLIYKHFEIFKWLKSLNCQVFVNYKNSIIFKCCEHSVMDIDIIKFLYEFYQPKIELNNFAILQVIIRNNKIDIFKYLLEKDNIKVYAGLKFNSNFIFKIIFERNYLDLFKCIDLNKITERKIFLFFQILCYDTKINFMDYIWNFIKHNLYNDNFEQVIYHLIFKIIVEKHNVIVATKLLKYKNDINITFRNHILMRSLIDQNINDDNILDCIKFIYTLRPDIYSLVFINNKFQKVIFKVKLHLSMAKPLDSNKIIECCLCYSQQSNVITSCNHQYCYDCMQILYNQYYADLLKIPCPCCRRKGLNVFKIIKTSFDSPKVKKRKLY